MLNAKAFANAVTTVAAVFYVICAALVFAAPDLVFSIANSWFHGISLEAVRSTKPLDLLAVVWGLITLVAVTWITTYGTITLYNKWANR